MFNMFTNRYYKKHIKEKRQSEGFVHDLDIIIKISHEGSK